MKLRTTLTFDALLFWGLMAAALAWNSGCGGPPLARHLDDGPADDGCQDMILRLEAWTGDSAARCYHPRHDLVREHEQWLCRCRAPKTHRQPYAAKGGV